MFLEQRLGLQKRTGCQEKFGPLNKQYAILMPLSRIKVRQGAGCTQNRGYWFWSGSGQPSLRPFGISAELYGKKNTDLSIGWVPQWLFRIQVTFTTFLLSKMLGAIQTRIGWLAPSFILTSISWGRWTERSIANAHTFLYLAWLFAFSALA